MVEIFITDSVDKYLENKSPEKILFLNGFIKECTFIPSTALEIFNSSLISIEDTANGLMLQKFDEDIKNIRNEDLNFPTNIFISGLPFSEKVHSILFNYYKLFYLKKISFQLVMESFFEHFSISNVPLVLFLSENYYLVQEIPYNIKSATYYSTSDNVFIKYFVKQVYYYFYNLIRKGKTLKRARIAIFIVDIPNEVDFFARFAELVKMKPELSLCIVQMLSGNLNEKKADASKYAAPNIEVTYLHKHKTSLYTDYSGFYSFCKKVNPLFNVFKKSRLCETEDIKYGFINNVITQVKPEVCIYINNQEEGRIMANVCKTHSIPSLCVDYAFFFDTFTTERRIRYDVRACISEVSVENWKKHHDPTPRYETTGFCRIDNWQSKPREKKEIRAIFDNDHRTILFASTWAPNPNSPLLIEKVKIVEQLSVICERNKWNLIVKKHPSEFDLFVDEAIAKNKYENQKVVAHSEIPLFDCMAYADFVCTQNSSAFIEALYLNKPFAYLTLFEENVWANMSYFAKEKEVGKFHSLEDYEQYLLLHSDRKSYEALTMELISLQKKYLYKTDGNASQRLLELVTSIINK